MTDEQKATARAQSREFPETMALLSRIRAALAEQLFQTKVLDTKAREEIYIRVVSLDAMTNEMQTILAGIASDKEIEEYAKQFATTEAE